MKSFYFSLEVEGGFSFPSKRVWGSLTSSKLGSFAWEAVWKKLLTLDQPRGYVSESIFCFKMYFMLYIYIYEIP